MMAEKNSPPKLKKVAPTANKNSTNTNPPPSFTSNKHKATKNSAHHIANGNSSAQNQTKKK